MRDKSLGSGETEDPVRVVNADGKTVNFYKLDKTRPYAVEGGALNAFSALFSSRAREEWKRRKTVVADGVLTDGIVVSLDCRRVTTGGTSRSAYYEVRLGYAFCDKEGTARGGTLETVYDAEPPFFVGQNLMIAFNADDSAVLSKFSLSEGAREFAQAEAERLAVDFECLSGKLLETDEPEKVKTYAYSWVWVLAGCVLAGLWLLAVLPVTIVAAVEGWGMPFAVLPAAVTGVFFLLPGIYMAVKGFKSVLKLKFILKKPSFTKGILFFRKTTYRGGANVVFYRYKDSDGGCRIEKFKGVTPSRLIDGQTVTVAYRGKISEIVTNVVVRNR